MFPFFCGLISALFQNASACYLRTGFPFSPQILLWMKSECLVYSSGSSIPPVAQVELISAASASPAAALWPETPDTFVVPNQTLPCTCAVSLRLSRNCWVSLEGFGNKTRKGEKKNLNPSLITPLAPVCQDSHAFCTAYTSWEDLAILSFMSVSLGGRRSLFSNPSWKSKC